MKLWACPVFVASLVVASPGTGSAQIQLRPGEYEVTIEMDLATGFSEEEQKALAGFLNQKQISRQCKTADQLGDANTIARAMAEEGKDLGCKISDLKTAGNKMTFTSTCVEDGQRMSSNNEITFGRDSYTMVATWKENLGRTSTIRATAKRIGDCKE